MLSLQVALTHNKVADPCYIHKYQSTELILYLICIYFLLANYKYKLSLQEQILFSFYFCFIFKV